VPHYRKFKAFEKDYIAAHDLEGDTGFVIESVVEEELPDDKGNKHPRMVIGLKGSDKKFVCNLTNGRRIARLARSPLTEDWIGLEIILYATECEAFGKITPCVRVRAEVSGGLPSEPIHAACRKAKVDTELILKSLQAQGHFTAYASIDSMTETDVQQVLPNLEKFIQHIVGDK